MDDNQNEYVEDSQIKSESPSTGINIIKKRTKVYLYLLFINK